MTGHNNLSPKLTVNLLKSRAWVLGTVIKNHNIYGTVFIKIAK